MSFLRCLPLAYSSWFRVPQQGMRQFELLSRGTACFVHRASGSAVSAERYRWVLVSGHVAAPQRFPEYYRQAWLRHVREAECRHVLEFRDERSRVACAWPLHRRGGERWRMTDIADILEQLEEDGGGGGIVERQNGSGSADGPHPSRHLSLVRHAEHADVAALRVQHPAEMLKSLSQLPPSYALCDADAATDDMPALSDALTVDGWAFAEHTDESPRVGSNADVARYVQRTGRIVQLPSLVNNSVQPEAQGLDAERRRRQMYTRSRGFVLLDAAPEWGLCGAAVVRTAAGASELVGLLEGRIQPSSTPTDSFDAQRLGAYVDVRAVAHLVEAPRETEAATPATADAVRLSAAP
ncbi:hypothetical protein CDCA_CDCA13G3650 [Cyanidium caldarium]|uniref:Uncharacterized protein n=1 Tax=Cyanidium caldarium TaxID=2771 RepID=A0AAV9IZT2_CYACA|nr:hypothetical protein CDCA_CDCA13G3650 [Cyanidium caldarium]